MPTVRGKRALDKVYGRRLGRWLDTAPFIVGFPLKVVLGALMIALACVAGGCLIVLLSYGMLLAGWM